jgi:hypothetical protein
MQTIGHVIINMTILGEATAQPEAVFWGAVLPDIPIITLYLYQRIAHKTPEETIWSVHYQKPFWLGLIHGAHSIALTAIGAVVAYFAGFQMVQAFFLSGLLHAICDFPAHNRDAHRHFFPFSDYRFLSPFSYWDSYCYAKYVAAFEAVCVLCCSLVLYSGNLSQRGALAVLLVNVAYVASYLKNFILPRFWRSESNQRGND